MKNKKIVIFLVILIILSGFGREFVMKNINWVIKYLTEGGSYWAQSIFDPLLNWSLKELVFLKWVLTIVFTGYFYGLTISIIYFAFPENKLYLKMTTFTYLLLLFVSFILVVYGVQINDLHALHPIIRNLMGVAQSFLPLMVLFLLFKFLPQKKA